MSEITHWINGNTFDDSAKRHGEIFNPATGEVSKKVAFGTAATVDVAVKAATDAFAEWRHSSLTKRVNVLFAFRELVNTNKEKIKRRNIRIHQESCRTTKAKKLSARSMD